MDPTRAILSTLSLPNQRDPGALTQRVTAKLGSNMVRVLSSSQHPAGQPNATQPLRSCPCTPLAIAGDAASAVPTTVGQTTRLPVLRIAFDTATATPQRRGRLHATAAATTSTTLRASAIRRLDAAAAVSSLGLRRGKGLVHRYRIPRSLHHLSNTRHTHRRQYGHASNKTQMVFKP